MFNMGNVFSKSLEELVDINELKNHLKKNKGIFSLTGNISSQVIYAITENVGANLIVAPDEIKAKEILEEYRFFDEEIVYFPPKDMLFYQSDIRGNALTRERIRAIETILIKDDYTIVTTIDALMNKLPSKSVFENGAIYISSGDELSLDDFRSKLSILGYDYMEQVEGPGEFSVRGGIIDIYPLTMEMPVRIELWGDEVDSIRSFDVESQKSIENLNEIIIFPAIELVLSKEELDRGLNRIESEYNKRYNELRETMQTKEAFSLKENIEYMLEETRAGILSIGLEPHISSFYDDLSSIIDYLPESARIFAIEPVKMEGAAEAIGLEFTESMQRRIESGYLLSSQLNNLYSGAEIIAKLSGTRLILMSALDSKSKKLKAEKHFSVKAQGVNAYNGSFELLCKELKSYKNQKYKVLLIMSSMTKAKRLAQDLLDEGLNSYYTDDLTHILQPSETMVIYGSGMKGYIYRDAAFVVLTDADIFGRQKKSKKKVKKYDGESIASFSDLHVGDYVVHENYGLGIYRGMEQMEYDGVIKDFLKIEYAKGSNLYVLASHFDAIQKYGSVEGTKKPKLNTLGGQEWAKTKARVQTAVGQVAKELVALYAKRQNTDGYVYGPDTVWQKEFEEAFLYEETEGQSNAIAAVKADMMSHKIMDRLICGDVGFGKTEVAIRAAFKAVQEGKQVAYLVPTTILAQQHYNTFVQRMGNYPVNVELMCRFRTAAEQKVTIKHLKTGEADIVVGTHRLLSADVEFKDLGLLIIDEEQRFGVNHKEKIKQLKNTVDVLSLSATPIPRTLHMSLIGIRDMSVLDEAPLERTPIQTFVFEYNEEMVREAILREMNRGGQVYYVHNRVRTIRDVAARVQELIPKASVAYAHGQMSESNLEDIMLSFINKEIDVLVATTIIEIGLDISNVNTIIIDDSDNMGLSQLYQLRGRVGRSNRTAFAFLMYRRDKMLKEVAQKRLEAIKEFTDLGSGFKIAMRDLEIRGAGNLLGIEQHGHMDAVGYDLYCKMLNEAVRIEKGLPADEIFDTIVDIGLEAFLPDTYVKSESQRIDLYKRIASIDDQASYDDMYDELIDRFGEPTKPVLNLLWVALLRTFAHKVYISKIEEKNSLIKIIMYEKAKIDGVKIPLLLEKHSPEVRFNMDPKNPYFTIQIDMNSKVKKNVVYKYLESFIYDMQELLLQV